MRTSKRGIDLIKKYEGCKLSAYKCPAGVWTIGYGHTGGVRQGQVITMEQAEEYLKQDLQKFEKGIDGYGLKLSQNQFDALVSFAYNLGLGNLSSSTLLRKAKKNPMDTSIYNEFLRWNKAGGKVLSGLTKRRTTEAKLYFTIGE
mgnify:FL=1